MMTLLPGLPDHVVAVCASGQVDAKDYETVLIPALDLALKKHKRVRMLYQIGPGFTGFTPGAMWDDAKVGLAHMQAWERVAIVTDVAWMAHAAQMFSFMMPGMVRVFPSTGMAEATQWIAA